MEPIDKLKEKVDKDPNSTLFVPLAEEYRKAGRHDEAIDVLVAGIERQPTYTSAKVSLGKIYLEKGQTADARKAFEEVISSNPDNFFAQKKLAEIFKTLGDAPRAIERYKVLLGMNPMDDSAQAEIRALEATMSRPADLPAATADATHLEHGEVSLSATAAEEVPPAEAAEDELSHAPRAAEEPSADIEEEMRKFSASLSEKDLTDETLAADAAEEVIEIEDEDEASDLSGAEAEAVVVTEEIASDASDAEIVEVAEEISSDAADAETVEVAEEIAPSFAALPPAAKPVPEPSPVFKPAPDLDAMIGEADFAVAAENFPRAMSIFNEVLNIEPKNRAALQRAAELQMLMKMLGRDSDMMEGKLVAFSEALARRRDEFRGNA